MYFATKLALLGILAAHGLALPAAGNTPAVVHERREHSHKRWIKREEIHSDTKVPVRIALKQRNLDQGMDYLMEVSDPESPHYGKHYTPDEITELFAPANHAVTSVRNWLVASGIANETISQPSSKGWLHFDAETKDLERLFGAKYHYYDHTSGGDQYIGCDEYSLPTSLRNHVDYVVPGVMPLGTRKRSNLAKRNTPTPGRPSVRPIPSSIASLDLQGVENCGTLITPACIKAMYNIPPGTKNASGNTLGIFEFGSFYVQSDLNSFFQNFSSFSNIPIGTGPDIIEIDNAQNDDREDISEADLDFQMAYPIVYPQGTTVFQTDDSQFHAGSGFGPSIGYRDGLYNNFLDAIDGSYCTYSAFNETGDSPTIDPVYPAGQRQCGVYKPTNVISISYGLSESSFPAYYQKRQCHEFMKLGLQGVSIVISSGDSGAAYDDGQCMEQDVFVPQYVNCPYVTMVGATTLPSGKNPGDPETSTTSFASGGGFSNIYPRPAYQAANVKAYFANHDPGYKYYNNTFSNGSYPLNGGLYNRLGRGYPDLAAVGDNGATFIEGQVTSSGGTSMSAPIVASIFTRINEERIAVGKKTIGFVNPTLYKHPEMFNDITMGNQSGFGCDTNGFLAVPGWDPISGMGTPKYDKMLAVFSALP